MKKFILLSLFLVITTTSVWSHSMTQAAMGVVNRRIPQIKDRITFIQIEDSLSKDIFEIEAKNGFLTVKGSSAVAMCRGMYVYLKEKCNCLITWEGSQLSIPDVLPDQPLRRVVASVPFRQHFNVVTFGYTTAFWNWERWAFEIDWMALHGINMPLAMTGQEKIWEDVWKSYGLNEADLNDFFTGPAFLPWNRLGCIYGNSDQVLATLGQDRSGRTLPKRFIERDAKMQRKIVARELELGMKPIIPGFSGFIPRALKKKYPDLKTWIPTPWNFACRSSLALNGLDPLFKEITNRFIDAYTTYYGDVSDFYLIDLFNEIDPPSSIKRDDLTEIARSVYVSLKNKRPRATWVMQGWCFYYQSYWKNKENTLAFLRDIPANDMIIIDLNADESEVFRAHPNSVAKKKIIWSLLNDNWGQRTPLRGCLDKIAEKPIRAMEELKSNLVGIGNSAEGIENNSICFELLYDNAWRKSVVDMQAWIKAYAHQRYQTRDDEAYRIWLQIYDLYYKEMASGDALPYQDIPHVRSRKLDTASSPERLLIEQMIKAYGKFGRSPLYQRDLVDVVKNYVGRHIATSIWKVTRAIETHDNRVASFRSEFDALMLGLDALLHTQEQHRLSTWINNARHYVGGKDQDYLEKNARLLLTTWVAPNWQGYARREWSGLVGDFYRARWNCFFDQLGSSDFNEADFNKFIFNWSNAWCNNLHLPKSTDCLPLEQSEKMLLLVDNLYSEMPSEKK